LVLGAVLVLTGCGGGQGAPAGATDDPPAAQRPIVDMLREGRDAPRHPADGGGRAWIEGDRTAVAGHPGRWTIIYEAGDLGVAVGGTVRLTVPPFWGWSEPQDYVPEVPGYTTAVCTGDGVELSPSVPDQSVYQVEVAGRPLAGGQRIRFVYGAGPALARADSYAERETPFWISVDGDGDGVADVLADSPTVDVIAGPPARLVLLLPSTARPDTQVELHAALVDRVGNAGVAFEGFLELTVAPPDIELPGRVEIGPQDAGRATVTFSVPPEGVVRILGRAMPTNARDDFGGFSGESNPMEVSQRSPRILWGDLQGHSGISDGTGTPEDYFAYARDVAALDVAVLTDHDHWGMLKLDESPRLWERIRRAVADYHEPGRFVALLGYEWTSWIHGHRHVLYFEDRGAVFSSVDEAYESPVDLWAALRRQDVPALTIAHHSAGDPIAVNWEIPPDPELEPITEIVSVHGVSEAADAPAVIHAPVPGNFVRDQLDRGSRFGFVGSTDGHDGHPGLAQLSAGQGGLAAILAEDATREAVLEALRERRCYATNGARIILRAALDGQRMGSTVEAPVGGTALLWIHAIGTAPIALVEVIRSGQVVEHTDAQGAWEFTAAQELEGVAPGEYVYVRVIQADGGLAWSSPFFVD
jgi:hypothetical protein